MTAQQAEAIRRICDVIVEAVGAADPSIGAPGGHLYAALMQYGCTLGQFEMLMSGLVRAGKLTKRGQCYFVAVR